MKEYKIAKGWAIFIYISAAALISIFGWYMFISFQIEDTSKILILFLFLLSLTMVIISIYGILDTYKTKLIIDKNKIISISLSSTLELPLDEIEGYKIKENHILVESKSESKKLSIKISKYLEHYNEIFIWISTNFTDIGKAQKEYEEREILKDKSIGWNKIDRIEKLTRARRFSKLINWCAAILAFWVILYPKPYQFVMTIAIIIPILTLLIIKGSNNLIRIDESKESAYPSVSSAFLFPSIGLTIRALIDFQILNYNDIWIPTLSITTLFLFLLFVIKNNIPNLKNKINLVSMGSLILLFYAYSFGVVIHLNCFYDNSKAKIYNAKILNKRISSGKTTIRYLELTPWGPQSDTKEVSIGKKLYNRLEIGDQVNIHLRQGKLKIPWFIVKIN